jgi:hypothetical protein
MFVYWAERLNMVGLRGQSALSLIVGHLLYGRVQSLHGMPLTVCLRGLTGTFSIVQPADNQAFPPTHPRMGARRAAGEAARPALLSIFPPFPGNHV